MRLIFVRVSNDKANLNRRFRDADYLIFVSTHVTRFEVSLTELGIYILYLYLITIMCQLI